MRLLRRWFLSGLLVWVPLGVTLWVIRTLIGLLDASLVLVPTALSPAWLGYPGVGTVLTLLLVLLTGVLTANLMGQKTLEMLEAAVHRIPVLGPVYGGMKKLAETFFSGKGQAFQKVVLVEFPHRDAWTVGFVTAAPPSQVRAALPEGDLVTVFVPTTPNPTSGFLLIKPRAEVRELNISVQDGMQYLISLGVVAPGTVPRGPTPPAGQTPASSI